MKWYSFINSLDSFFDSYVYKYNGVTLSCKLDKSSLKPKNDGIHLLVDFFVDVDNPSKSEYETIHREYKGFPIAELPIYDEQNDGFKGPYKIHKTVYKLIPSSGYTMFDGTLQYTNPYKVVFFSDTTYVYRSGVKNTKSSESKISASDVNKIPLITFIRAITGKSYKEINTFFDGMINFSIPAEYLSADVETCAQKVLKMLYSNKPRSISSTNSFNDLHNYLCVNSTGLAGKEKIRKFQDIQSFHRLEGTIIHKIPSYANVEVGTTITRQVANALDALDETNPVLECQVKIPSTGKIVTFKRCKCSLEEDSVVKEQFNPEEFMYAVYNYLLTTVGIPYSDDRNSLDCCVLQDATEIIKSNLHRILYNISRNLAKHLDSSPNKDNILDECIFNKVFEPTGENKTPLNHMLDYIKSSDESRDSDVTNSLATFQQSYKISKIKLPCYQQIHESHVGRIDPYATPESKDAGLNSVMCLRASIDQYKYITRPVYKVNNGVVDTSKEIQLSTLDELYKIIAPYGVNLTDYIEGNKIVQKCTLNFKEIDVPVSEVEYQLAYQNSAGPALSGCFYAAHNNSKRLDMANNAINQAAPVIIPERSYIRSELDDLDVGIYRAKDIIKSCCSSKGITFDNSIPYTLSQVKVITDDKNLTIVGKLNPPIKLSDGNYFADIKATFTRTFKSANSTYNRLNLKPSKTGVYANDDIVLYMNDIDLYGDNEHSFAVGNNIKVLFICNEGFGYEDSAQISKRYRDNFGLCTPNSTKLVEEDEDNIFIYTNKYRGNKATEDYLNDEGLPKVGTRLYPGNVVIGRCRPDTTTMKDIPSPVTLKNKEEGIVLYSKKTVRNGHTYIEIMLWNLLTVDAGDKLTGFHGNKSVCSRAINIEDMFYTADGQVPDLILNPLGVPGRENVGQLIESIQAEISKQSNKYVKYDPSQPINVHDLVMEAEGYDIKPVKVYDPKTGEPLREKCFIGTMYFTRSTHIMSSKYNACTLKTSISATTHQTRHETGGGGGQRISEMTAWSYKALGCNIVYDTLTSLHSDDLEHLSELKQAINLNKPYTGDYSNCNADRLTAYFRFLGINFYSQSGVTKFEPIGTKKAETLIPQPFTATDLVEHDNIICAKYSNLSSKNRSEEYSRRHTSLRTDYAKIDTKFDFIHPLFMSQASFCNLFLYTKAYKMEKGKVVVDDKITPLSQNKMSSLLSKSSAKVKETCYIGVIGSNRNKGDDSCVIRNDVDITGLFVILNSKIANMCCADDPYKRKYFEIVQDEYKTVLYNDIRDVFHCIYNPESVQDGEDPLNGRTFYNLTTAERYFRDSANFIKNIAIDEDESSPEDTSIVKFDIVSEDTEVIDEILPELSDDTDSDSESENDIPSGIDDKNKKMVNYYAVFRMFKNTYAKPGMTGFGEFMTKYMIIPPPLVRPMKDLKAISTTGAQSTYLTTIGKEMSTIVKSIKGNDVPAVIYEHIANSIGKTFSHDISAKDLDQYSVFVELFRHSNKKSVVRDQMVAKRIDFSGRSVISVNPRLRMGQSGVPLRLALTIHERRIIHDLMELKNSIIKNVVDSNYGNSRDLQRTEKINIYSDICQKLSTGAFNKIKINNLVGDYTTKSSLIKAMKQELINITNRVLRMYPAVLSRDPALHQFSIAGFNTIVTDGFAIEIHPLSCKGFNADFDGDQMSVNYPQHAEAIKELQRVGMFGINLINPQSGESIIEYAQDSVAGFYYATVDEPNPNDIKDVVYIEHNNRYSGDLMFRHYDLLNLYDKLESRMLSVSDTIILYYKGDKYLTTVGRAMFNSLTGFEETLSTTNPSPNITDENGNVVYYFVKYNSPIKKGTIRDIVTKYIIEHKAECDKERLENNLTPYEGKHGEMLAIFDRYKDFGYYMSKESGITLSIWDLDAVTEPTVDKSIDAANDSSIRVGTYKSLGFLTDASTKKIRKGIWSDCDTDLTNQFKNSLKNSKSLQLMIDSGARGTVSNLVHMCGMVGTVLNTAQEEMEQPIRSSYAKGLCISEQLANSYNGRRVLLNTQLGTPITGEQTRQLIYMAEHLHIVNNPDTYEHSCDARPTTIELEYSLDIQALKDELSTQSLVAFNPARYSEYLQYCNDNNLTPAINASDAYRWDTCVDLMESYESSDYQDKYIVKSYISNNVNQAILKSAGKYYVVNLKYKLDELYRNILKMRSLEMKTIADNNLVKQLKAVCNLEVEYDYQGMIDKMWYIITDKGINLIEKYHVHKIGIYTIIGCKHRDGICPRCFGYDYKNLQKPVIGLNIGHVAAQAIGECTTQLTLDTHKADSSGKGDNNAKLSDGNMDVAWREPKNLNINAAAYINKLVDEYQNALSEDICMGVISENEVSEYPRFTEENPPISFARTSGRISVNKYRNFYLITLGDDQCITDSSCINVCDGEYVYKGKSFISYPLIDKMFANAPVKYKDGVELGIPDVVSINKSSTNPYYEEYANPAWLEAAKDVWLTIVKEVISKFGVLGRNIETIVRTMVEIGLALETREELNIFRGYYYPVSLLRDAEITYLVHPVSYSKNMLYHNKIIANMAKDDPKSSITQAIVYGLEDSGSTITDILTSALHVVDADGNVNIVRQSVGVPINSTDDMDSLINKILSNMEINTENIAPEEKHEESENSISDADNSYYDLDDADDTNLF